LGLQGIIFMATGQLNGVLKQIRRLVAAENADQLADRQLLDRYVQDRDEAAFAALVNRHGAMVLNVCRRVLHNHSDAEDACQATFLVLARKAHAIRKKDAVASWLHGVAFRAANNLRREIAQRVRREKNATTPRTDSSSDITWREMRTILDDEIQKLPEELKGPVLLFCLEGKTHNEGAQQLGWSLTTFRGRLERARDLLRKRLRRRGVALSGVLLASFLSGSTASAALSATFVISTVRAAMGRAAASVVSQKVVVLTEGMVKAMFFKKLKIVAIFFLAIAGSGLGLALAMRGLPRAEARGPVEQPTPQEKAPDKNGDRLGGRRWIGVSAQVDGVTSRHSGQPGVTPPSSWDLTEDAGRCISVTDHRGENNYPNEAAFRFKYKLDTAAQPKAIDLFPEEGPAKGKTLRGIYSLDCDELKICYVSPNTVDPEKKPRPGEFAAAKDSGYVLLVFRDLDGIGRVWKGVAAEVDGAKVAPPPVWGFGRMGGGGIGIRDEYRPHDGPNDVVFFFKHKLDASARPKAIDLMPVEGPAKGKTLRGIYALEGDEFKICYVSPCVPEPEKKARPSEFAAPKGSGHVLLVFRVHMLDASVLDKAGFDKAELEWARSVLAAARAHGMSYTKQAHENWVKEMDKQERLSDWIWAMAINLDREGALPATVVHPVESRLAGKAPPALEGTWHNTAKPLSWDDLKGKVVLLDFMGEACVPCFKGIPKLNALHEQFHDKGLVLISVFKGSDKTIPAFLKKHGIAFPVVVDATDANKYGSRTFMRYGIWRMPTYLLVDRTGKVVPRGGEQLHDVPTAEEIEKLLDR
jgi:RNA polymerase sigma factor (sigma-70 family)